MSFTQQQQKRIDYFRRSVRLDDVTTKSDPAYQFSDDDLWGILDYSAPVHIGLTLDESNDADFYFILLLAKREIYYRLATTTAPFYPLEAEGASLEKNVRFDHYIKLVEVVTEEYDNLYGKKFGDGPDSTGTGGVLTTYNAKLEGKTYVNRYNQLSDSPLIELRTSEVTTSSVNLDWDKYQSTAGNDFTQYKVYVSEDLIYDDYAPNPEVISIKPIFNIEDIRKTKIRVTNLEPDKEYYLLITVQSLKGLMGMSQVKVRTLSGVMPKEDMEVLLGGKE